MVSVEKLNRLWQDYKIRHDLEARQDLILNYAYIVRSTTNRIITGKLAGFDHEDIISAGVIGLIKSVDHFDPARHVKFEAYATKMIRLAIFDYFRELDSLPRSVRDKIKLARKTQSDLERELGRSPTIEELANRLHLASSDLGLLRSQIRYAEPLSLEDPVGEDGDHASRLDFLVDESMNPEQFLLNDEIRTQLIQALDRLPEREKKILSLYYHNGLTFREMGSLIGVSETRVHQLHGQAISRLRNSFRRSGMNIDQ
jgi:RNA polymerase sigma factor for flagellar operon FliA